MKSTWFALRILVRLWTLRFIWACWDFPSGSVVKNPFAVPEMQETWVRSLDQEAPLEKGMAIYSRIFDWRIPRTEEPGGLLSMGLQRVSHDCVTDRHIQTHLIWKKGEGWHECFLPY